LKVKKLFFYGKIGKSKVTKKVFKQKDVQLPYFKGLQGNFEAEKIKRAIEQIKMSSFLNLCSF